MAYLAARGATWKLAEPVPVIFSAGHHGILFKQAREARLAREARHRALRDHIAGNPGVLDAFQ